MRCGGVSVTGGPTERPRAARPIWTASEGTRARAASCLMGEGRRTLKITGSPVTERLSPSEARAVREKGLRAQWTLYVNPKTYLPVRLSSAAHTYGGPAPSALFTTVTDLQWLRPTTANIVRTLVTIPPRFRQVSSPANQ